MNEIIFHMENQDGEFLLDSLESKIIDINDDSEEEADFGDSDRFIPLPGWSSQDGYRLMEKFNSEIKNPVARQELSEALNKNKGVFRSFKNIIEQYPEIEKLWLKFKEQKMKNEVTAWYNSLREMWGMEPVGAEPEDTSSLVLEDFIFRAGEISDAQNAAALHNFCIKEREDAASAVYEELNPFVFPGDICLVAENASENFCGCICAIKNSSSHLQISLLEVKPEYRGMGLGKTLLEKLLEKTESKNLISIDLPAGMDYFSRTLHLENFKPCLRRFIRK